MKELIDKFPGFFKGIVETIVAQGPIALLVLILFILLGGIYLFRRELLANPLFRKGFALLSLLLVSLFIYLIYEISESFILGRMVVIKGAVTYSRLDSGGGALTFDIVGPSTGDAGDKQDFFYSYDSGFTEKQILVIAKPERIRITVSNRPLLKACSEDNAGVGGRSANYQTTYTIKLPDEAYKKMSTGAAKALIYVMDFDYKVSAGKDLLTISGFRGIDPAKISTTVKHTPERECLDEDRNAKYIEVQQAAAELPLAASAIQIVSLFGNALTSRAHAAEKSSAEIGGIIDLLGARDSVLSGKARNVVSQTPDDYLSAIVGVFRSSDAADARKQTNALIALKGVQKAPALSRQSVEDIVRLSYAPAPDLRLAARNYLTDPAILSEDMANTAAAYYAREKEALNRRDPQAFLLLALTMREIMYVAGVNNIVEYTGNWGERDRKPEAIEASLARFNTGAKIIADVPPDNAVPFAKVYYGKALALRSRVAVDAAVAALGPKADSKQIDTHIYYQAKASAPLPFNESARAEFMATLDSFFKLVEGREQEYLWPAHIEKMKACRQAQTYSCIR